VPAAAVIPAPIAYIKVVAVKKLVVGSWRKVSKKQRRRKVLLFFGGFNDQKEGFQKTKREKKTDQKNFLVFFSREERKKSAKTFFFLPFEYGLECFFFFCSLFFLGSKPFFFHVREKEYAFFRCFFDSIRCTNSVYRLTYVI